MPLKLEAYRLHKGSVLLKFEGIDDRDAAQNLSNAYVQIPEAEVFPLPEGQYYHFQLLGIKAYSPAGNFLGYISEILPQSHHDIWVLKTDTKETLVPALKQFVRNVDIKAGTVTVELPPEWRNED